MNPFGFLDGADDPAGLLVGLVLGLVLMLFGGIVLTFAVLASEVLLLALVLLPLLAAARVFWVIPWVVEARRGQATLGVWRARGWGASAELIRTVSDAYRRGEDPETPSDGAFRMPGEPLSP